MPNPGSFLGLRKEFIEAQSAAYAAAVASGDVNDVVSDIQRRYFKRFPPTLEHNVDPTQEWLDQVDDSAPDADIPMPSTDLPLEEFQQQSLRYDKLKEEIKARKDQIKRRLHYIYTKSRERQTTFDKTSGDVLSALAAKLSGASLVKPRKKTPANLWGPENRALVDPIFNERSRDVPASQHLKIRSAIYKELFEALPSSEQAEWQSRADREHDVAIKAQKDAMGAPPSTAPADRQKIITALPKILEPMLDLVAQYTGWKGSLMIGGPEPGDNGRLNMVSIHFGVAPGTVRMDFGRSERATFKNHIQPAFGRFLKKCFTIEECRSMALPSGHQELQLSTVAVEEDVDVHRFDYDYQHMQPASSKVHPLVARSQALAKEKASSSQPSGSGSTSNAPTKAKEQVKIGPPAGKRKTGKSTRVAPVGAKDKPLGPLALNHTASASATGSSVSSASTALQPSAPVIEPTAGSGMSSAPKGPAVTSRDVTDKSQTTKEPSAPAPPPSPHPSPPPSRQPSPSPCQNPVPPPPGESSLLAQDPASTGAAPSPDPLSQSQSRDGTTLHQDHSTSHQHSFSGQHLPAKSTEATSFPQNPAPVQPHSRKTTPFHQDLPPPGHSGTPKISPALHSPRSLPPSPSMSASLGGRGVSPLHGGASTHAIRNDVVDGIGVAVPTTKPAQVVEMQDDNSGRMLVDKPSQSQIIGTSTLTVGTVHSRDTTAPKTLKSPIANPLPHTPSSGAAIVPGDDELDALITSKTKRRAGAASSASTRSKSAATASTSAKRKANDASSGPSSKKSRTELNAAFTVDLPPNAAIPAWLSAPLNLLTSSTLGPEWEDLVSRWMVFERARGFEQDAGTLPSTSRPAIIADWIKRARKSVSAGAFGSLDDFEIKFAAWWKSLQPPGRVNEGTGELTRVAADWSCLRVSGRNGFISVVAALFFWGQEVVGDAERQQRWALARDDVAYVVEQLNQAA